MTEERGGGASLTTEPAAGTSSATDVSLLVHLSAEVVHLKELRRADERFYDERDRRYAEVGEARAEALRIKEHADKEALRLARADTDARELAHNGLLEQLKEQRADNPTRAEVESAFKEVAATIKPLSDFVISQQGAAQAAASMIIAATRRTNTSIAVAVLTVAGLELVLKYA